VSAQRLLAVALVVMAMTHAPYVHAADATIIEQANIKGGEAHPGDPALPCTRPTGTTLACSQIENGVPVLDLKVANISGHFIAIVHPGSRGREVRIVAVTSKGKRKELSKKVLNPNAWQSITATIDDVSELDHLQLVSLGLEPFWLTGAAIRADGPALLSDMKLLPNPLQKIDYDGSQGLTQTARTLATGPLPGTLLRVLTPGSGNADEKAGGDRLVAAIAKGWNTQPQPNLAKVNQPKAPVADVLPTPPVVIDAGTVRWYSNNIDFSTAIDAALAELPQLLVINLATNRSPAIKPDALAKLMTQANRSGVLVALVLDQRPDDIKLVREWQQWLVPMHTASPAMGIIDLQEIHDWYAQPGATPDTVNLLLGDIVDRPGIVTLGFTDLKHRYEWELYNARLEAVPSDNSLRRRTGLRQQR